ncbi:MAG: hypothetical protein AMXMBFR64_03530 [Myxococcales bacterium]
MSERAKLLTILAVFAGLWFLPAESPRLLGAIAESLALTRWYAREHVILCLVPAFFIAGAISVFISQGAVMRYLGASARPVVSYAVAAVSGTVLAVCSCTVLPLFAGIHKRGAGLGPATAFLYAGPAINVMAIILTAQVIGFELGVARAVAAVVFSVVVGLLMHALFRRSEAERAEGFATPAEAPARPLWQTSTTFASMVGVLVFANWAAPQGADGLASAVHSARWLLVALFAVPLVVAVVRWFNREELRDWMDATWDFAKQILPLLLGGVLVAGLLLGGPSGGEGLIPRRFVEATVGGEGLAPTFFAAVAGSLMYFATLTEIPIVAGLQQAGMGDGPALALLLAGPALSLPSMLVIHGVLGTRRTAAFVGLVVVLSTVAGMAYGALR